MPRITDIPLHRIHIRLEQSQIQWLKKELGDERMISEVIRQLVRNLIFQRERRNGKIPDTEEMFENAEK